MGKYLYWIVGAIAFIFLALSFKKSSAFGGTYGSPSKNHKTQAVIDDILKGQTEGNKRFCGDLYYINRDKGGIEAVKQYVFNAAKVWEPVSNEQNDYKLYSYPNIEYWIGIKNGKPATDKGNISEEVINLMASVGSGNIVGAVGHVGGLITSLG